ncbi:MAG: hypothetical protein K0R39_805 [Symbiobacteriaceae bacterium]|nr:hypothetical protein [Symbiobacteriaceae bacterium]
MQRIFRTKLMLPSCAGYLPRPRLLDAVGAPPRALLLQAPAGAGKTAFLAQWLPATGLPFVYYRLDAQDREGGGALVVHLGAAFARVWPDWAVPEVGAPAPVAPAPVAPAPVADLAADLVAEAAVRPPIILALDGLEAAFGQPWLADFLTLLLRYAPPELHLLLSTRAPLPVDPGADCRTLLAADLAFTRQEASALLGAQSDWEECWTKTGGFPLALDLWRQHGAGWRPAITSRMLAELPGHVPTEIAKSLVGEWLAGNLSLTAFAHQFSVGQPGAEQLWTELGEIHMLYCDHPPAARERATVVWDAARGRGDRPVMAAAAMLLGEISVVLGQYALATEWYRQAFEIDPMLELAGAHSKVILLRDQGRLDEAEALARRCLEARANRGDLTALAMAHLTYGEVSLDRGRLEEAEEHLSEAERLHQTFSANLPIGITATCQRALVAATRGDMPTFRRLAEAAYGTARGRFRFLEACTGMVLAAALVAWGDHAAAERLLVASFAYHSSIEANFYLHYLLTLFARKAWAEGKLDEARRSFDRALGYAAAEGYLQHLVAPRVAAAGLIADALARGVEAPFCQELLIRMGGRALPALLEMTRQPEPRARQAALYPLSVTGGEAATEAVRSLLHDDDPAVRDAALLAYQALLRATPAAATAEPAGAGAAATTPAPGSASAAESTTPRLTVSLLGPITVTIGGRPLPRWRTTKARDLLAYFVLQGSRPIPRDQVIEALWPDLDFDAARTLLHTTLYNLRSTLGAPGEGLVTFAGGAYRMERTNLTVDIEQFEQLAAAEAETDWRKAADLYRGDLAEGLDYPWAAAPRARARLLYQQTLRQIAVHCAAAARHADAAQALQLLLQVDPLDEEAHLGLMTAYAALGNRSAALQQYRTIARLLDDELGLEPGPRTQELYRRLLD